MSAENRGRNRDQDRQPLQNRDAPDPEMRGSGTPQGFTDRMTTGEAAAVLLYLPLHIWGLPTLLMTLPWTAERLSDLDVNIWVYGFGALYMLLFAGRFLRREFDPLCDRPAWCLLQILICYGMMMAFNLILGIVLAPFLPENTANPNNQAVLELIRVDYGKTAALAVFLSPLVEEPIFRGAVFGQVSRKNRIAAYLVSMVLFSLYHVWGYALTDPMYWIYLIQYLPVSWLLCRCYERCDSIWGSIFLHMLINGISMHLLSSIGSLGI